MNKYSHNGLLRAVVKDNKDPKKLRRIKLQIAQTSGKEVTDWAWPIISTERPPAIGSGVYAGYFGGDPEYPFWIGEFGKNPQGIFSYGSWLNSSTLTAALNTETSVTFSTKIYQEGVKLKNGSKLVVEESGIYNIQFSAQIHNTGGGGSGELMYVWFKRNGKDISNSATAMHVSSNQYRVMTVNIFQKMKAKDYFEVYWSTTNVNIRLEGISAASLPACPHPAVPSIIVTVNQIA